MHVLPRGDWTFRVALNKRLSQSYSDPQILDIYLKWFAARPDLLRATVYNFGTFPLLPSIQTLEQSNSSTSLAKRSGQAVDLVDQDDVDLPGSDIVQKPLQAGTIG
jgi:hypothetical protein